MRNHITVTIADQEYNVLATEDESYVRKVREVMADGRISAANAAILAALNIADEYYKEQETSENLRRQLKEYLEEGTKLKMELSEAKREIFKLQNSKK